MRAKFVIPHTTYSNSVCVIECGYVCARVHACSSACVPVSLCIAHAHTRHARALINRHTCTLSLSHTRTHTHTHEHTQASERGSGLGRLLMTSVESHARELGCTRIILSTSDQQVCFVFFHVAHYTEHLMIFVATLYTHKNQSVTRTQYTNPHNTQIKLICVLWS